MSGYFGQNQPAVELYREKQRAEAAEARVKELERIAELRELEQQTAKIAEDRIGQLEAQNARLRAALESLQADEQSTIDQYNKNGPTWTSRDSGAEYYSASYVIDGAEERIATIKAALNGEEAST